jgi:DNA adenine methylase
MVITPMKYIGSKYNLAPLIISSIPPHNVYVEVFGGSAAVLFHKPPSKIEIYNDIDKHIVTLFRVLRNNADELKELLDLTLFSREEFNLAFRLIRGGSFENDLQHAWAVFVAFNQAVSGVVTYKRGGWSYGTVRNNTFDFTNRIDNILSMRDRLRNVYIENLDYAQIFKKYDGPDTFFYLDPPYTPASRSIDDHYLSDMKQDEHAKLIADINKLQGKCIVSGYEDPIYETLENFQKVKITTKSHSRIDRVAVDRTEILWISRGCYLQLTLNL